MTEWESERLVARVASGGRRHGLGVKSWKVTVGGTCSQLQSERLGLETDEVPSNSDSL